MHSTVPLRKPPSAQGKSLEKWRGFPDIGCLVVKQLTCPHAKHHPQTGTHIQTAPHLSHRYTSVLFITRSHRLYTFQKELYVCSSGSEVTHFIFIPPTPTTKALTGIGQTKTVQHTTKQSYLHPHPQECPPDNKSSVSDQGSCHLAVLILRQKSQSHMSAFRLLWGTWLGMTYHCLQVGNLDCP